MGTLREAISEHKDVWTFTQNSQGTWIALNQKTGRRLYGSDAQDMPWQVDADPRIWDR